MGAFAQVLCVRECCCLIIVVRMSKAMENEEEKIGSTRVESI